MGLDTGDSGRPLAHRCYRAIRVCLRLCLFLLPSLSLWGHHSRWLWGRCHTRHTQQPLSFAQALSQG